MALLAFGLLGSSPAHATWLWWDVDIAPDPIASDGSGVWSNQSLTWNDGGQSVAWSSVTPDAAIFGAGNGAAGTVTVANVTAAGLMFEPPGGGSYVLAGGTVTLASASTVIMDVDGVVNSVVGGLDWTKNGASQLTLSGANTFTGALSLAAGTLKASGASATALGTGAATLSMSPGTALHLAHSAAVSYGRTTSISGSVTIRTDRNVAGAGVTHTLGPLSMGTSTLTVPGLTATSGSQGLTFGATTLSGDPTFCVSNPPTGGNTLLTIGSIASFANTITLNGNGNFSQGGGWLGGGAGALTTLASYTGTNTLASSNAFTGELTLNGGVTRVTQAYGLGSVAGGTTVGSGAALDVSAVVAAGEPIGITGAGFGGNGVLISTTVGSLPSVSTVTLNGHSSVGGPGTLTLNGPVVDAGGPWALTKVGTGVLVLNGTNTFGGGLTVGAGTLRTGAGVGIPATGGVTLSGAGAVWASTGTNTTALGTGLGGVSLPSGAVGFSAVGGPLVLNLGNGTNLVWGDASFNPNPLLLNSGLASNTLVVLNNIDLNGAVRTIQVDAAYTNTATLAGTVSGSGAAGLTKTGTGVLVLSGTNTFGGSTTINAGVLRAQDVTAIPTNTFGRIIINGVATSAVWEANGLISRSVGSLPRTISIPGGSSGFSAFGGLLTLVLGSNTLVWGGADFNPGAFVLNAISADSPVQVLNNIDFGTTGRIVQVDAAATNTASLAGILGGSAGGGLIKTGSGTLVLTNNNTYIGRTTLNAGVLSVDHLPNGGVASPLGQSDSGASNLVLSGGTLQFTASGAFTNDRNFTLGSGTTGSIDITNALTTLTLTGVSSNNNGGLTKVGAGTLVLGGANLHTGVTTVAAGALAYGVDNALLTGGITVSGGTLDMRSYTDSVGTVTLTNGVITGTTGVLSPGAALAANGNSTTSTISGTIGGPFGLAKSGSGLLRITSTNNTYTGQTTMPVAAAGSVVEIMSLGNVGVACSLGQPTTISNATISIGSAAVAATLRYVGPGDASSDRKIALAGTTGGAVLDVATNGNLTLTSDLVTSGAGAKSLTLTGSGTGVGTLMGSLTNNGGALALIKSGTGTWVLNSGASTYTGATTINGGALAITNVANGGSASPIGASSSGASNLVLSAGTLRFAAGPGTYNTDRNFTLTAATTNAIEVSNASATLTVGGTANTSGTLVKLGSGALVLAGTNLHTGATIVSNGTLVVAVGLAPASSVTINGGTLAPGPEGSAGAVVSNANLTLNSGALAFEMGPTTNDVIVVTNTLTINGGGVYVYTATNHADSWTSDRIYNLVRYTTLAGAGPSALTVLNPVTNKAYVFGTSAGWLTLRISSSGVTWDGGGSDDNWAGTPANWNPDSTPTEFSTLTFAGTTRLTPNNNFPSGTKFGGFAFSDSPSPAGAFTLVGNTVNLVGDVVNNSVTLQSVNLPLVLDSANRDFNAASGDLVVGNSIDDGGNGLGLSKSGANTLKLSGTNTFGGTVAVNAGALKIQSDSALGTTNGGTTVSVGAALQMADGITVGAEPLTLSGTGVAGDGALRNLGGSNTYGGRVTLTGATTIKSDAGRLTLDVAAGSAVTGAAQNVTFGGAGEILVADPISTVGGTVTKVDNGTLILSGANTYTGLTTIAGGVVNLRSATGLGTTGAGTVVTNGAALQLQDGIISAEPLTLYGSGVAGDGVLRNISGANTNSGAITLGSGVRINSDSGALTLSTAINAAGQDLAFGGAGTTTVSSAIGAAAGALVKDGTGWLTLSVANTFTNGLSVKAGTVNALVATSLGTNTMPVLLGDGSGNLDAAINIGGAVAVANPITVVAGNAGIATLTDTAAGIFTGPVTLDNHSLSLAAGTSALTVRGGITGSGTLTLNANGPGAILVSTNPVNQAGAVVNAGAGPGSATISSGVGSNVTVVSENSTNSALTLSVSPLLVNATATTLANNNVAGTNLLTVSGGVSGIGNLIVNNNSSIANGITLSTAPVNHMGAILNSGVGSGSVLISGGVGSNVVAIMEQSGSSSLVIGTNALTVNGAGTTLINNNISGSNQLVVLGGVNGTGSLVLQNNSLVGSGIMIAGATVAFNGAITNSGAASGSSLIAAVIGPAVSGVVQDSASSPLYLGASNTYSGLTTIRNGTLALAVTNALPSGVTASNVMINSAGKLDLNGCNQIMGMLLGDGAVDNGATDGACTLALGNNNQTGTFSGVIRNSTGTIGITKVGTGVQTLAGTNTYSGGVWVQNGKLTLAVLDDSHNGAGNIRLGNAAVAGELEYTGANSVSLTRSVELVGTTGAGIISANGAGGATLILNNLAVSGAGVKQVMLQGGGAAILNATITNGPTANTLLTKAGAGTWTLTGNNTYSGVTTNSDGILRIGDGGTSGSVGAGTVVNNGILVFNRSDTYTNGPVISGSGSVQVVRGTLTLTNANTYTGLTTVSNCVLRLGRTNALPSTATASNLLLVGAGQLDLNGCNQVLGVLLGNGRVDTSTAAGTNTVTIGTNSQSGAFSGIIANTVGTVALVKVGGGTQTLSGASTFAGPTTVSQGMLAYGTHNALGTGNVTVNGTDATLAVGSFTDSVGTVTLVSGAITGAGVLGSSSGFVLSNTVATVCTPVLAGAVGLVKMGLGTATLSNACTYSGATVVNAGTLNLPGSLASVSVTVGNGATLTGSGTCSGVITNASGGTLAAGTAGTAGGKLTAGSLMLMPGCSNVFEFSASTNDSVSVTVPGGLTIDGGSIWLFAQGTNTPWNTSGVYTLFRCSGVVGGAGVQSLSVANPLPGKNYAFSTNASGVVLTISGNAIWDGGAADDNWRSALNWLDDTIPVAGNGLTFAGTTRLSPFNDFVGGTLFGGIAFDPTAGAFTLGGASMRLGGNVINNSANPQTISLPLILDNVGRQFNAANSSLVIDGTISDAGNTLGITKTGTNALTLAALNTYGGGTFINAGILSVSVLDDGGQPSGIGASSAAAANLVLGGGTLQYTGDSVAVDRGFTLSAGTTSGIEVPANTELAILGSAAASSGSLDKRGVGTLTLRGQNLYTGNTTIYDGGTLKLGANDTLSDSSSIIITNGTVDVDVYSDTVNQVILPLQGDGRIIGSGTLSASLFSFVGGGTVNPATGTMTANAVLGGGDVDGSGRTVLDVGYMTAYINASNTFIGRTQIRSAAFLYGAVMANGGVPCALGACSSNPTNWYFDDAYFVYTGPSTTSDRSWVQRRQAQFYIPTAGTTLNLLGSSTNIVSDSGAIVTTDSGIEMGGPGALGLGGTYRYGPTSRFYVGAFFGGSGPVLYPGTIWFNGEYKYMGGSAVSNPPVWVCTGSTFGGTGTVWGVTTNDNATLSPGLPLIAGGSLNLNRLYFAGGNNTLAFDFNAGSNDWINVMEENGLDFRSTVTNQVYLYEEGSTTAWARSGTYNLLRYTNSLSRDAFYFSGVIRVANPQRNKTYTFSPLTTNGTWLTLTIGDLPVWDGGGADGNWLTATNWEVDAVPPVDVPLTFAGSVRTTNSNNSAAFTRYAGLYFETNAGAFALTGNPITLTGNITNSSPMSQRIDLAMVLDATGRVIHAGAGNVVVNGAIGETNGSAGITKSGTNTLTLAGANTFTGPTMVSNGILRLTGSLTASSTVTVSSNATLSGTGNCAGSVTIGSNGTVAPGLTGVPGGKLTVGSLTWEAGSLGDFEFDLSTNDQIDVTASGGLTLLGGGLNVNPDLSTVESSFTNRYNLIHYTGVLNGSPDNLTVRNGKPGLVYAFTNVNNWIQLVVMATPLALVDNEGGAQNVTETSASLLGRLLYDNVQDAWVTLYYGTTDGGTATTWESSVFLDIVGVGDLATPVSDLTPDRTYYYRYSASNNVGVTLAPTTSVFITSVVWIEKTADVNEAGPGNGIFTLHRAATASAEPLTIEYAVDPSSTAMADTNYIPLSGSVTFSPGADTATIDVMPLFDKPNRSDTVLTVYLTSGRCPFGVTNASLTILNSPYPVRTWTAATGDGKWSTPENWDPVGIPEPYDAVRFTSSCVSNCEADLDIPGILGSLTLASGYTGKVTFGVGAVSANPMVLTCVEDLLVESGTIRMVGDTSVLPYGRGYTIAASNVTIASSANVNSDQGGFLRGPGRYTTYYAASSHGGQGGGHAAALYTSDILHRGSMYGSPTHPTELGSGNDKLGYPLSGGGGGAIKIIVSGTVTIDGRLTANTAGNASSGTSSGGSIWITGGTLQGGGVIAAQGQPNNGATCGTGGGGRIDISETTNNFTGAISAAAGRNLGGNETRGQTGSVLLPRTGGTGCSFDNFVPYGTNFAFGNSIVFGSCVVTNGVLLTLDCNDGQNDFYFDTLTIKSGGMVRCMGNVISINTNAGGSVSSLMGIGVNLYVSNLTVEAGGSLNADGTGFRKFVNFPHPGNSGYGGLAGNGYGSTYGTLSNVTALGSGVTSHGGGAIKLVVYGALTNDGIISCNGTGSGNTTNGSGGSLWIDCDLLAGSGIISANGSSLNGTAAASGGGGGRVHLLYNQKGDINPVDSGTIMVNGGGTVGDLDAKGGAGTILLTDRGTGLQHLRVVNNGPSTNLAYTPLPTDQAVWVFDSIVVAPYGVLRLPNGLTLQVTSAFSNQDTFWGVGNSTVMLMGTNDIEIDGNNTFANFVTTNAVMRNLRFAPGSSNAVDRLLLIQNARLESVTEGQQWFLKLNPASGTQDVRRVRVRDSNAGGGATIMVKGRDSASLGNNVNWHFDVGSILILR